MQGGGGRQERRTIVSKEGEVLALAVGAGDGRDLRAGRVYFGLFAK